MTKGNVSGKIHPKTEERMKERTYMPIVRVNDIDVYYEIHGKGELVVLIAGLNSDHTLYRGILPQLATRYQVIVFDNRGVGQTDKPDIPYTIEMAEAIS
jgi:3-oxoadipate enol-lactonase